MSWPSATLAAFRPKKPYIESDSTSTTKPRNTMIPFLAAFVLCAAFVLAIIATTVAYFAPIVAPFIDEMVYFGFSFLAGEAPDVEPRELRRWLFSMEREELKKFLDDLWDQNRGGSGVLIEA